MEIRKMTTLDVIKVANILKDEILDAVDRTGKDEEGKRNYRGIVTEFIGSILDKAEKGQGEALEWTASLINMTPKEFIESDPATVIELIDALIENEEMKDFSTKRRSCYRS